MTRQQEGSADLFSWMEGLVLMMLYLIIAVSFWYYPVRLGLLICSGKGHRLTSRVQTRPLWLGVEIDVLTLCVNCNTRCTADLLMVYYLRIIADTRTNTDAGLGFL